MGQDRVSASPSSAAVLPMHSHPGGDALTPTASAAAASASTNPRILLLPHPPLNPHTVGQAARRLPGGGSFRTLQKGADISNARPSSACRGENSICRLPFARMGWDACQMARPAILRKRLLCAYYAEKRREKYTPPSDLCGHARLLTVRGGTWGASAEVTVQTPPCPLSTSERRPFSGRDFFGTGWYRLSCADRLGASVIFSQRHVY